MPDFDEIYIQQQAPLEEEAFRFRNDFDHRDIGLWPMTS